ncbi:hypothetical protein CRG98_003492 [Punica granatum]|uniref:Uncharacterized protein n=1 Tax=Punica granatum TaxID=22663 RepID=A0A2I0L5Y2_PUNGR|nr:hypothetical protein CRG98_003492 [Punica granatum]
MTACFEQTWVDSKGGVEAANLRPRPLHRGCRYPQKTPTTSVEGSGSPIGGPNPESTKDSKSEVPGILVVGVANRRPRPLHRGHQYPRRMPATSVEGSGSSIGGLTLNRPGTSDSESLVDSELGRPIAKLQNVRRKGRAYLQSDDSTISNRNSANRRRWMEALKVDKLTCWKKQVVDSQSKLVESASGRREKSDWKEGEGFGSGLLSLGFGPLPGPSLGRIGPKHRIVESARFCDSTSQQTILA